MKSDERRGQQIMRHSPLICNWTWIPPARNFSSVLSLHCKFWTEKILKSWSKCLKIWNIHTNIWLSQMSSHVSTKFISSIKIWCVIGWITEFSGPRTKFLEHDFLQRRMDGLHFYHLWEMSVSVSVWRSLCLNCVAKYLKSPLNAKRQATDVGSEFLCSSFQTIDNHEINEVLTRPYCVEEGFNPIVSQ